LSALPITINKHVATTVGEAGQKVKEDIDKQTVSSMKSPLSANSEIANCKNRSQGTPKYNFHAKMTPK
jgi:hypothetical protein